MKTNHYIPDDFFSHYHELLDGQYDCVDRIVLNAYYLLGQTPGGFRTWWRQVHGDDTQLNETVVIRYAGRFARRIRAYAKKNGIPVIECGKGEWKHEARKQKIDFIKDGNCFIHFSNATDLAGVAETMIRGDADVGRLAKVCERWIYSSCLCFALELNEQKRCAFQYSVSSTAPVSRGRKGNRPGLSSRSRDLSII